MQALWYLIARAWVRLTPNYDGPNRELLKAALRAYERGAR